ncbi:hypothetical protein Sjap_017918 [Stephania japonica]|uniref:Dihydrolipoamide acetyltransferase component of pyruvate dehydrogenase complex n=1 Tax=Stephania japonica TaxID=461633 RepID=A0AAP0I717_9MAGN
MLGSFKRALKKLTMKKKYHNMFTFKPLATPVDRPFEEAVPQHRQQQHNLSLKLIGEANPREDEIKTTTTTNTNNGRETEISDFTFKPPMMPVDEPFMWSPVISPPLTRPLSLSFEEAVPHQRRQQQQSFKLIEEADPQQVKIKTTTTTTNNCNNNNNNSGRETEIIEMVDLEGQDHGPSSSSVGDNDDDFIVYSKEGNNARWFKKEGDDVSAEDILCEVETDNATVAMECTEEVFLAKIIHGDGTKVIKVGEVKGNVQLRYIMVNATTVEDEDDIAKFKDYKPSQLGDSKEAKVPSDPSPPTPPKKEDTEPVSLAEPKKPKVANAPQSGSRIFASPLARKLANDHNVPLSKIKGTGSDGTIVQADIEDYLGTSILLISSSIVLLIVFDSNCESGKGVLAPPTSKPKDKATEAGINYTDLPISQIRKPCHGLICGGYSYKNTTNVNVVQTEHGLFVPVVRGADKKGLSKIADGVKSFTQKAKENSLKIEDYKGGTFTVSNLGGTYGIKQFCAVINPPQSGILAVGSWCDWRGVAQSIQRLRREPRIHATLNDSFVVKSQTVRNVSLVCGSSHSRSPLIINSINIGFD